MSVLYAIQCPESTLFFDGFGSLVSLLYAEIYPDWSDCPGVIVLDGEVLRFGLAGYPWDAFIYGNKQGTKRLEIVELECSERNSKDG